MENFELKPSHRLILFDLDGTALKSSLTATLSSRLKNAIINSDVNLKFSIATGRSWTHFWPLIDDLTAYLQPCIISGGSQIVSPRTREILWQIGLSDEQIRELNRVAKIFNKPLAFNDGAETRDPQPQINDARPTIVYLLDIKPEELDKVFAATQKISGLHPVITSAWGDSEDKVLHITHQSAHKGTGTKRLIEILKISTKNVTAIGDGLNDLPMFSEVGNSLAIEGSIIENEPVVTGRVGRPENEGIASYIESLNNV